MTKIVSTEKARQGGWGRDVLMVLIGGLVLAFVVWAVVGVYGQMIAPAEVDTQTTAPANQTTTPGTQQPAPSN